MRCAEDGDSRGRVARLLYGSGGKYVGVHAAGYGSGLVYWPRKTYRDRSTLRRTHLRPALTHLGRDRMQFESNALAKCVEKRTLSRNRIQVMIIPTGGLWQR